MLRIQRSGGLVDDDDDDDDDFDHDDDDDDDDNDDDCDDNNKDENADDKSYAKTTTYSNMYISVKITISNLFFCIFRVCDLYRPGWLTHNVMGQGSTTARQPKNNARSHTNNNARNATSHTETTVLTVENNALRPGENSQQPAHTKAKAAENNSCAENAVNSATKTENGTVTLENSGVKADNADKNSVVTAEQCEQSIKAENAAANSGSDSSSVRFENCAPKDAESQQSGVGSKPANGAHQTSEDKMASMEDDGNVWVGEPKLPPPPKVTPVSQAGSPESQTNGPQTKPAASQSDNKTELSQNSAPILPEKQALISQGNATPDVDNDALLKSSEPDKCETDERESCQQDNVAFDVEETALQCGTHPQQLHIHNNIHDAFDQSEETRV
jgi:hypothetical protein